MSLEGDLLFVAVRLATPFTKEDLVVAAWRAFPLSFGLEGYPHLPDSNRVYPKITGLCDKEFLVRLENGLLEVAAPILRLARQIELSKG